MFHGRVSAAKSRTPECESRVGVVPAAGDFRIARALDFGWAQVLAVEGVGHAPRLPGEPGGVVGLAEQICVTFHEMRVRFMSVAAL